MRVACHFVSYSCSDVSRTNIVHHWLSKASFNVGFIRVFIDIKYVECGTILMKKDDKSFLRVDKF